MKKIIGLIWCSVGLMAMEPLITADWLKEAIADKKVIVIDVSDSESYRREHIPGSVNSPIGQWRKKQQDHLLVKDKEEIQKLVRDLGIDNQSRVVVYSHHENAKDILKSTYVLWALEYYGLKETALLDGGLPAWKRIQVEVETTLPTLKKGDFVAKANSELVANLQEVKDAIGQTQMVDARPAKYYFGAQKQEVLKRAGHIPEAKSYFWQYSFEGSYIKEREELYSMLVEGLGFDPDKPMITYCTGGLETSMNFFILHRLLGFNNIRLYDASMKEWANRDDVPIVRYKWE